MQFKYPEILYALFLLLIPVFIHLFQLRRFEKVAFTNVAFLKKVELQTRKSSKLKKFLILLSRLGLFTALIIAFAQPYFSDFKQNLQPKTILYLDNSLSMQAKNGSDELLKHAVHSIISNFSSETNLTILTNNDYYKDLNKKALKNQLLSLEYSPFSQGINTSLLQANNIFDSDKEHRNNMILISDFQSNTIEDKLLLSDDVQYSFVQLTPQYKKNISIDSVYIAKQDGLNIDINVVLKSHNVSSENLSVSLFKEDILVGKTTSELIKNKTNTVSFNIPFKDDFNGRIVIEDNFIEFDNELFFTLNKPEKINVLAIGNSNKFLAKIYTKPEFNLSNKTLNQIDYNQIANQNLIVLNELEIIPLSLQKPLIYFVNNGGSLVVIPAIKTEISSYNKFLTALKIGSINQKQEVDFFINTINFSHPILNNVFDKKIENFQYPTTKSFYPSIFKNKTSILKFNNQTDFISQIKINHKGTIGKFYWIASSINQLNSDFKNSPLIVPIFYNFGKQSFQLTELFYIIGNENNIDIKTPIVNDEVLKITQINTKKQPLQFIPLQQVSQNKVTLKIQDEPSKAGFFKIFKTKESLKNIAFNYNRIESKKTYADMEQMVKPFDNASYSNNIKHTFEQIKSQFKVKNYWKWFLTLAILFIIIETLLIKFLKQ